MKKLLAASLAVLLALTSLCGAALADNDPTAVPEGTVADTITAVSSETVSAETVSAETSAVPETAATPVPVEATAVPTIAPTSAPTAAPTVAQTAAPTATPVATAVPTVSPEASPSPTPLVESAGATVSGEVRVTMGADLTKTQRAAIYADFGVAEGSVPELTVTNKEERAYLEGLVPDNKIGSVALSCIYIETMPEGSGLDLKLNNINYCTGDMYRNALTTAGISDAKVIVSAPYPVSGTGALTGAYKAYEDITGKSLSQLAKAVGAQELVVTGELAEYIGSDDATAMINELKGMLDQTQTMTDDQVRTEIKKIADTYQVAITDAQMEQVLALVRKLEGLDTQQLQEKLVNLAKTANTVNNAGQTVSKVFDNVKGFFASVGSFFTNLFGGKKG